MMDWLKKHADTVSIMLTIIITAVSSITWMNGKFNEVEKDIAIIKTVLIMKNIMPSEMAKKEKQ